MPRIPALASALVTAATASALILSGSAVADAATASPKTTTAAKTTAATKTTPSVKASAARWTPAPGTTFQIQFSGKLNTAVDAQVFDIDGELSTAKQVQTLQAKGSKVVCYINAGAAEDYRTDYWKFPAFVMGEGNGWEGEKMLDIRRIDILKPIMAARMDMCKSKGFDAVDTDLMDTYALPTGFPLTAAHQLAYNKMLAGLAHERGMSIGLKNALLQVKDLVNDFDFSINEQCFEYDECGYLTPFVTAGKAVFQIEYNLKPAKYCTKSKALKFTSIKKPLELGAARTVCP